VRRETGKSNGRLEGARDRKGLVKKREKGDLGPSGLSVLVNECVCVCVCVCV